MNWLMVPAFGVIGAALATVLTYFLWTTASMFVSESLWRVAFPLRIFLFQITASAMFTTMFIMNFEFRLASLSHCLGFLLACMLIILGVGRMRSGDDQTFPLFLAT